MKISINCVKSCTSNISGYIQVSNLQKAVQLQFEYENVNISTYVNK